MMFPLFRRNARQDTISSLYGTIVAQARLPCFYREYGVPDTINGRFDLLVLHLAVVVNRLERDPSLRDLGQALFDKFCQDMDDNLREMGVGDLAVPKQMQRMGEAFYGRAQAYWEALATANGEMLAGAAARNVYGGVPPSPAAAARLAAYIREAVRDLDVQKPSGILAGEIHLADPLAVVLVEDKTNSSED
jgi:cytochrome b pre-mRNA-processing protein 3